MCCVVEQGRTEKGIFSGLDIYRAFAGTQEKGLNSGLPFPSKCRPKRHKREIFGFSSLSLCLTGFFSKSLAWNLPHYYTRVSPEESRLMHIALVYMIPCILAFFKIVCWICPRLIVVVSFDKDNGRQYLRGEGRGGGCLTRRTRKLSRQTGKKKKKKKKRASLLLTTMGFSSFFLFRRRKGTKKNPPPLQLFPRDGETQDRQKKERERALHKKRPCCRVCTGWRIYFWFEISRGSKLKEHMKRSWKYFLVHVKEFLINTF